MLVIYSGSRIEKPFDRRLLTPKKGTKYHINCNWNGLHN